MGFPDLSLRRGFTLMELVAVIAILAMIALFAVSRLGGLGDRARQIAADHDLKTIREAILRPDGGYLADMSGIPGFSLAYLRVANLLVATNLFGEVLDGTDHVRGIRVDDYQATDAAGRVAAGCAPWNAYVEWDGLRERGWRGPYVKHEIGVFPADDGRGFYPEVSGLRLPAAFLDPSVSVYGFPGEPAILDPWGNPYVLQIPPAQAFEGGVTNVSDELRFRYARLVSAGPDRRLQTPCFVGNATNDWREAGMNWQDARFRRISRQAGLVDGTDRRLRGDDLVLFLRRNDIDEGEEVP